MNTKKPKAQNNQSVDTNWQAMVSRCGTSQSAWSGLQQVQLWPLGGPCFLLSGPYPEEAR